MSMMDSNCPYHKPWIITSPRISFSLSLPWRISCSDMVRPLWIRCLAHNDAGVKARQDRYRSLSRILLWRAMNRPSVLQLSACVTPKVVLHLSQWLWGVRGGTLKHAHKKSQNSTAENNIPKTVVLCTLIHAPVLLNCRIRIMFVPLRYQTKPLSLVLFATSQSFCPSRLSSLSICRWYVLENASPPVTAQISSEIPRWDLMCFSFA